MAVAGATGATVTVAAAAKQDFINSAQTIPYAALLKDTTPYVGNKIALHGQILQIQQQQGQGGTISSVLAQTSALTSTLEYPHEVRVDAKVWDEAYEIGFPVQPVGFDFCAT